MVSFHSKYLSILISKKEEEEKVTEEVIVNYANLLSCNIASNLEVTPSKEKSRLEITEKSEVGKWFQAPRRRLLSSMRFILDP